MEFADKEFHYRPRITRAVSSKRTSRALSAHRYLEAGIFLVASAGEKREPLPCRNQGKLRNTIDHVSINLDAFDLCLIEGSTTGYSMVSLSLETEARRGDSFRALRGPGVSLPHFSGNRSQASHCLRANAEDRKQ